jgi:hypothetical protein
MTEQRISDTTPAKCPNCGAIIAINGIVCSSCGINIAAYRGASQWIGQLREAHQNTHSHAAAADAAALSAAEGAESRKSFVRDIRLGVGLLLLVTLATLVAAFLLATHVRERRERLEDAYHQSVVCMQVGDYVCARDSLVQLLEQAPTYPGARDMLNGVYDRWYTDALARGDPITALSVWFEKGIRLKLPK